MKVFIIIVLLCILIIAQPLLWYKVFLTTITSQIPDGAPGVCSLSCILVIIGIGVIVGYIANQRKEELESLFKPKK